MLLGWRWGRCLPLGLRTHTTKAENVRVIYRGGPYMRKPYFYAAGACFVLAGLNFGLFIRDYFVWPLFPTDGAVPELARPSLRYSLAAGTVLFASLCGWYFVFAPSRMVTRLTVYPATGLLGIRTAAPSPSRLLPSAWTRRPFFQRAGTVSPHDARERLVPLRDVYRLQGSAEGSEMQVWDELLQGRHKDAVPAAMRSRLARFKLGASKYDQQDMLMLRVGASRLAFQLTARPDASSLAPVPPPRSARCHQPRRPRGGRAARAAHAAQRAVVPRPRQVRSAVSARCVALPEAHVVYIPCGRACVVSYCRTRCAWWCSVCENA